MNIIKTFIESGIIESYVLGIATDTERAEVEQMAQEHAEVRDAVDGFSRTFENVLLQNPVTPDPTIKPFLMAIIDYTERLQNGEEPAFPPVLNENSLIEDYTPWLNRPDMVLPVDFKDIHAKIIGFTPEVTTAIAWIKHMAPQEVHHDEYEKFLIVEGSCDITIEDKVHHLSAGSMLSIPLYASHHVTITSSIPCKIILQRVAA